MTTCDTGRAKAQGVDTARGWIRLLALAAAAALWMSGCGGGGSGGDGGAAPPAGGVTLSGTVTVQALSRVDSDTNDPDAPVTRNDDPASAQVLDAPAVLGGHVAAPGSLSSRFGPDGDPFDVFRVDLAAGQRVRLEFLASTSRDFDLGLFDLDGELVDASTSPISAIETVTAPADGGYFVVVQAFAGEGNYRLVVPPAPVTGARSDERSDAGDPSPTRLDGSAVSRRATDDGGRRAPAAAVLPDAFIVRPAQTASDDALPLSGRVERDAARALAAEMLAAGFEPASTSAAQAARRDVVVGRGADGAPGEAALAAGVEQRWRLPPERREQALRALGLPPEARARLHAPEDRDVTFDARWQALMVAKRLMQHPAVEAATPDLWLQTQASNDPLRPFQWAHDRMAVAEAWRETRGGRSPDPVIVAVVDTGVFLAHEDLRDRLVSGYDFISDPERARDGDGIDPNPDDPGDSPRPGESSWHGTHVAGIVAATADNALGVAGIAPEAQVMPVRVLGVGGGTLFDVLQGIRFAAGLPNDSGTLPPQAADIINLSLGGGVADPVSEALFREVAARNIVVVAAAGNFARGEVEFPARYDDVFAVGASDARGQRAPYSNFGAGLDLLAPGGDLRQTVDGASGGVVSTLVDDRSGTRRSDYGWYQGTSMAAPALAGVLALGRAIKPDLSPAEVRTLLESGALTNADVRTDASGWGELDAFVAVSRIRALASGEPLPNRLVASAALVDFGPVEVSRTLRLRNPGATGPVTFSVSADWLTVSPLAVDARGLGDYQLRVNRSLLAPDSRVETEVTFSQPDTTPVTVRVRAERSATTLNDSVGRAYVLLLDEQAEVVDAVAIATSSGRASFEFRDVAPGRYRLVAGTDMNGDLFICDPFEACGAYPTGSLPEAFDVTGDRANLDFTVGFVPSLLSGASEPSTDAGADSRDRGLWRPPTDRQMRAEGATRRLWPGHVGVR